MRAKREEETEVIGHPTRDDEVSDHAILTTDRKAALSALAVPRRRKGLRVLPAMLLLLALLLNVCTGEPEANRFIPPSVALRVLAHHLPWIGVLPPLNANLQIADEILLQLRLPRSLGGLLVGMLLALAGVAFQSLLMNPLADPYTVGVASGSALGAVAITLLGGAAWMGGFAQPLAAFLSGLGAVAIVYAIARVGGRVSAQTFLLSGTLVGLFFWALIPLFLTLGAKPGEGRKTGEILAALFGSLEPIGWSRVGLLLPFALAGMFLLWRSAPELDLMAFGEETAAHLGVDTESFKRRVILAGTLMTAAAVAAAGIIGFVGFIVPHLARRLVGPSHRALLPAAALLGGLVLVLADWVSRVFLHNIEVGVVTSLLGVPVFCTMLRKRADR